MFYEHEPPSHFFRLYFALLFDDVDDDGDMVVKVKVKKDSTLQLKEYSIAQEVKLIS